MTDYMQYWMGIAGGIAAWEFGIAIAKDISGPISPQIDTVAASLALLIYLALVYLRYPITQNTGDAS